MGRPTNREKRTEQILDAFEWCVAKYGVEGATLEKIAERAGLARALIRHHVGNRDQLLDVFVDRFMKKTYQSTDELFDSLPDSDRVNALIEYLFDPIYTDAQMVLVIWALISAAFDRPKLADQLDDWVRYYVTAIADELNAAFPNRDEQDIKAVATGISGIYFNVDSLMPLGSMKTIRQSSKEAAIILVSHLSA